MGPADAARKRPRAARPGRRRLELIGAEATRAGGHRSVEAGQKRAPGDDVDDARCALGRELSGRIGDHLDARDLRALQVADQGDRIRNLAAVDQDLDPAAAQQSHLAVRSHFDRRNSSEQIECARRPRLGIVANDIARAVDRRPLGRRCDDDDVILIRRGFGASRRRRRRRRCRRGGGGLPPGGGNPDQRRDRHARAQPRAPCPAGHRSGPLERQDTHMGQQIERPLELVISRLCPGTGRRRLLAGHDPMFGIFIIAGSARCNCHNKRRSGSNGNQRLASAGLASCRVNAESRVRFISSHPIIHTEIGTF